MLFPSFFSCSDAAPRNTEADAPVVGIDCYHQRTVGSCNADYMKTFLKELVFIDGLCMVRGLAWWKRAGSRAC